MDKKEKRVLSDNFIIGAIFLGLVLVFSFFSTPISRVYKLLLSVTGEANYSESKNVSDDDSRDAAYIKTMKKKIKLNKKKRIQRAKNPVLVVAPLTETPEIVVLGKSSAVDFKKGKRFPVLRLYNAEKYDEIKTEIEMVIKDNFLNITIFCEEPPGNMVKEYNPQTPWKFDSIELFLRKDAKSVKGTPYVQYVVSAAGNWACYPMKTIDGIRQNQHASKKNSFIEPILKSTKLSNGFRVNMKIALSNIDIKADKTSKIYMQLVRNYPKKNACLQLFPVYLYADSQFGNSNHDQRAMKEVRLIKEK
jgi:hypothetical protein